MATLGVVVGRRTSGSFLINNSKYFFLPNYVLSFPWSHHLELIQLSYSGDWATYGTGQLLCPYFELGRLGKDENLETYFAHSVLDPDEVFC